MSFKIDAKTNYTQITPEATTLDAVLAALLLKECIKLVDNGSNNFIVDVSSCISAVPDAFEKLQELHTFCYGQGHSLVFTGVRDEVLRSMKEQAAHEHLNVAPTHAEAVDIISMEILERDLFDEE